MSKRKALPTPSSSLSDDSKIDQLDDGPVEVLQQPTSNEEGEQSFDDVICHEIAPFLTEGHE